MKLVRYHFASASAALLTFFMALHCFAPVIIHHGDGRVFRVTIKRGPTLFPKHPRVDEEVTFSAAAVSSQSRPLTYAWKFGDSTGETNGATETGSAEVTHTYKTPGYYRVRLSVTDDYRAYTGNTWLSYDAEDSGLLTIFVGCPAAPLNTANVTALIRKNEGVSDTVYFDTATPPHPTIGIGFNLDRRDARRALKTVGADYDSVMAGASLTFSQIDELFEADLQKAIRLGRAIVGGPAYDKLPEAAKEVVIDMTFNLNTKFREFRKMLHALRVGDLETAADELEDSEFFEQVGLRGPRLKLLLLNCGRASSN